MSCRSGPCWGPPFGCRMLERKEGVTEMFLWGFAWNEKSPDRGLWSSVHSTLCTSAVLNSGFWQISTFFHQQPHYTILLSLSQMPSLWLLFLRNSKGEETFSLACHSIHPPRHPLLNQTGKERKSGFHTNLRKCFKPSSKYVIYRMWHNSTVLLSKSLRRQVSRASMNPFLFSLARDLAYQRGGIFPFPGLAGISGILMVPLGTIGRSTFICPLRWKCIQYGTVFFASYTLVLSIAHWLSMLAGITWIEHNVACSLCHWSAGISRTMSYQSLKVGNHSNRCLVSAGLTVLTHHSTMSPKPEDSDSSPSPVDSVITASQSSVSSSVKEVEWLSSIPEWADIHLLIDWG
jgi:hypothetical protein